MTLNLMFVDIIFCSVWFPVWSPLRKQLLTRSTVCSLCILTKCYFCFSRFAIGGGILVKIAPVPGHCLLVSFPI